MNREAHEADRQSYCAKDNQCAILEQGTCRVISSLLPSTICRLRSTILTGFHPRVSMQHAPDIRS
eukprot:1711072-Rhodomonas_salina.3